MKAMSSPDLYWYQRLSALPSHFERLFQVSSTRNFVTGLYRHDGLAQMFGDDPTDQALRRVHARVFQDWLCLSLEEQKADLRLALPHLSPDEAGLLAYWRDQAAYERLLPDGASPAERSLYSQDLRVLLELFKLPDQPE